MDPQITSDADEYGRHVRSGGWALGLLIARNVTTDPPVGNPGLQDHPTVSDETVAKISARAFADIAGVPHATVSRHLKRWDHAATLGHVPPSDTLSPGSEVPLDVAALPEWRGFPLGPTLSMEDAPVPEVEADAGDQVEEDEPEEDLSAVAHVAGSAGPQPYQVLKRVRELLEGIESASEAIAYLDDVDQASADLRERSA